MDKKEMKQQIVDIVKDYAEGNYHLDITEHDLHIAADRIVKLFAIPVVSNNEVAVCSCGNKLTEKEVFYETCLVCMATVEQTDC